MSIDQIPPYPEAPLTVAISDCLLGAPVRYDGGHKRSALPHDKLQGLFRFQAICPEVGIGLGVPREPIKLVGRSDTPRALGGVDGSLDVTQSLRAFARRELPRIESADGYIFMKNSPSCGLFSVKVYDRNGVPSGTGRGVFADEVTQAKPLLPVEEGTRLNDAMLRENFVTRVFVHAHWRRLREKGITARSLVAFHTRYKYLVMAHSVPKYQSIGRLLSNLSTSFDSIAKEYISELMQALANPATRGGHANVLSHLQGYVKSELPGPVRQELADLIESYQRGEVPLLAPLTLLKHHLGMHEATYALNQLYLQPHPIRSGLRRDL